MARGQSGPSSTDGPIVTSTRQHAFVIPFRIGPAREAKEEPVEVQLNVSSDRGATWEVADRVKPDKGKFVFRAAHDGEYWYAIRTVDGQGVARPGGQLQVQLKVIVDTVAPRLELTASRGAAGEIIARWQAVDPHLKPTSFKLEYQSSPGGPWQRVAVAAPPSAMRHTSSGEATWWPKTSGGTLRVRGEITDASGNPAVNQAVVKLDEFSGAAAVGSTPRDGPSFESTRWPADRATAEPLGHGSRYNEPANAGGRSVYDATTGPDGRSVFDTPRARGEVDWNGSTPPAEARRTPTRAAPRKDERTVRDPAKPSPLDFGILPSGEHARMVGSRTFELQYEIDSVGASGVSRVELWGTLDGGRTWSVYGVDADNRSPLPVRVQREGIYGFRIIVKSGSGLGGEPPRVGDPADVWIAVDLANPAGRITAAEVSDDGAEVVITWEAGDDMLEARPISLEFAETRRGPWSPIASGLENSGSYTWRHEDRVGPVIFVRMEVRDEAGNIGHFDWTEPVSLDRSRPEGRIHGVRALK